MVERRSHVADSPDQQRSGTEWFLDAVFPNGKTITIRGFAGESEASECPGSFPYLGPAWADRGGLGAPATVLSSNNENARVLDSILVPAMSPERTAQVSSHTNGSGLDGQTFPATLKSLMPSTSRLALLASTSLTRFSEKWRTATTGPWFALMCAGASFAALLLLAGAFAGVALTKQPVRLDMTEGPRIGAITPREQSQLSERNYDADLIALLIELTSYPSATRPEEAERKHSAPDSVPLGLPRILLDARSFATVPLSDRPTNGYFD
jgi:hypothetical protein